MNVIQDADAEFFCVRQCKRCAHPLYNVLASAPLLLGQIDKKVNENILKRAQMQRGGRYVFAASVSAEDYGTSMSLQQSERRNRKCVFSVFVKTLPGLINEKDP